MTSSVEEYEKQTARPRSRQGLVQIAIAFATVFCPLLLVAILLCLFVTLPKWTVHSILETNANLPVRPLDDSKLWTQIVSNQVTLTSSFASNIAQFAASPFLLLFSFLVALEVAKRHEDPEPAATRLLQRNEKLWSIVQVWRAGKTHRAKGTTIAGLGALLSLFLTFLLITGDKLLQGTIEQMPQEIYYPNYIDPDSDGSFKLDVKECPPQPTISDPYVAAAPPCSIDSESPEPWTLRGAPAAYRILATGLLNQTHDYHKEDFGALSNSSDAGAFDWKQLVTHFDKATNDSHVFLFDPSWAEEDNITHSHSKLALVDNEYTRLGFDYIADTTSIVTKCLPITTTTCGMNTTTGNTSSVPYHCSDFFHGDLSKVPDNGLERLKGWNTSFYAIDNGSPREVSIASQLNPFSYNVTATVDSINLAGLNAFRDNTGDPQVHDGIIVGSGDNHVSFALSCTSTVYDVRYSLVWGNVHIFNKTLAAPATAAIIKAPIQAGFGSYALYEKVAMAVLMTNLTVMDYMDLAFSQTFLALAAGVYTRAPNVEQRVRGELMLTTLGKGPFYFLVVGMFVYALVVVVFAVIALTLFWRSDVREVHMKLMPEE